MTYSPNIKILTAAQFFVGLGIGEGTSNPAQRQLFLALQRTFTALSASSSALVETSTANGNDMRNALAEVICLFCVFVFLCFCVFVFLCFVFWLLCFIIFANFIFFCFFNLDFYRRRSATRSSKSAR